MSTMDWSNITFVGLQAALHAGEILRRGFGSAYRVTLKPGAQNFVTDIDIAAEDAIIALIREHFPDHGFIAEESGISASAGSKESSVTWIIDPLDGTVNFMHNIPLFAVNIAAYAKGKVQLAITYAPILQELFMAQRGAGAYLNGSKLHVTKTNHCDKMIAATGLPYVLDAAKQWMDPFSKIIQLGNPVRDIGSAALALAYIAAGRFDAYWIPSVQPWDMAAGILLIEEAGGQVTKYRGEEFDVFTPTSLLATNGHLHKAMMDCLNQEKTT